MEALRPCPFCGRSDTMCFSNNHEECDDDIDVPTMYIVVCSMHDGGCGAHSGYYETKREAAAAWNRRAERTCRNVCEWNIDTFHFTCSECGAEIDGDDWGDSPVFVGDYHEQLRYCPNCGAKVVDE